MDEAEYSAYLKEKTYEELLSISGSIDKVGQPKRHAMVLAEIDARDKRGETLQRGPERRAIRPVELTKESMENIISTGSLLAFVYAGDGAWSLLRQDNELHHHPIAIEWTLVVIIASLAYGLRRKSRICGCLLVLLLTSMLFLPLQSPHHYFAQFLSLLIDIWMIAATRMTFRLHQNNSAPLRGPLSKPP